MLFQNAKIQDLNVIHNGKGILGKALSVVSECKDTRFECNSQLAIHTDIFCNVVSECKDTRFECNSQQMTGKTTSASCCFRMQRYKI